MTPNRRVRWQATSHDENSWPRSAARQWRGRSRRAFSSRQSCLCAATARTRLDREGRTVAIEYRWAEEHSERYSDIAAEFVRLKVDVIVTVGSAVAATEQ